MGVFFTDFFMACQRGLRNIGFVTQVSDVDNPKTRIVVVCKRLLRTPFSARYHVVLPQEFRFLGLRRFFGHLVATVACNASTNNLYPYLVTRRILCYVLTKKYVCGSLR